MTFKDHFQTKLFDDSIKCSFAVKILNYGNFTAKDLHGKDLLRVFNGDLLSQNYYIA